MNECSLNSGFCITALKCTGPRTKAHFTFKSSQEELPVPQAHHNSVTIVTASSVIPCHGPSAPDGEAPHSSATCPCSLCYSGHLFPSSLQILTSSRPHCFHETFGPHQPTGISPSGDSARNTETICLGLQLALKCLL